MEGRLVGAETHGFYTMKDLDIGNMMEEAKARWLRPNEIHAVLCNYKYFTINVKPVNLPKSGTIVLFDRKMLRNFRKDGHNWKKKKDGKTVKEAHEHLKVGNEERIHVYYAHGEDNPTFVRRCYWLLDKALEHIVLVHYRETQEGSPVTSLNSNSNSPHSDLAASWQLSEEYESPAPVSMPPETDDSTLKSYEMQLHEINTLEWDELLVPNDPTKLISPGEGKMLSFEQNQYEINGCGINGNSLAASKLCSEDSLENFPEQVPGSNSVKFNLPDNLHFDTIGGQMKSNLQREGEGIGYNQVNGGLQTQDSFGMWMNHIMTDTPGPVDDQTLESSVSTHSSLTSHTMDQHQSFVQENMIRITDVSPAWAFPNEETKILVIGSFPDGYQPLAKSNLFCVCGDTCVPTEVVQSGVFRCFLPPHSPGLVNLYLSLDGRMPISQVVKFEYRTSLTPNWTVSSEDNSNWEEFQVQMRLFHLLFSTSKSISIFSSKVSQNALKQAKAFNNRTSHIANSWAYLTKSIKENKISYPQAKNILFELSLQNRLREWLLERVLEGCKVSNRDEQGQGVIHLCAILGYTWAVPLFLLSGLSLDYRDKFGWTALHWAAYYGREKMVATLLSAGAKPNFVTDPTSANPGGCTAADLASKNGFEGLAAYLAENALVDHLKDMTISGNASGSLETTTSDSVNLQNIGDEELYLKETLAAYRTAAGAAARIQAAFRERSLKLQAKAVEFSNPEDEARSIVAALKIQHAFRNYETQKKMKAAARIQYRFRTWKIRKDYLNMRRQAIKIQSVFRGFQVRRQYRKIIWSVGVLEKAILRWRLKRKGFRGLQVNPCESNQDQKQEDDAIEEDFFQVSRKQAEERVERSVVRVQAMFRSKLAQEEYRRMKLEHNKARLEFEDLMNPDIDMVINDYYG